MFFYYKIVKFKLVMRFCISCLFCALSIIASCSPLQFNHELSDVESYIKDHPDSALKVLEEMDVSRFKSKKDRSLHALLHAMALDKNFIDVDDDSLANVALDYFEHYGPRYYKARALYYKGLAFYYAANYNLAIVEFSKAEQVSRECGDSLYLGMTYVCLADTYSGVYNDLQEIHYLLKAKKVFTNIAEEHFLSAVDKRLGDAYMNNRDYETSYDILSDLISREGVSENIQASAMVSFAYLHMTKPDIDPKVAHHYYSAVYDMGRADLIGERNYWAWATAMSILNMKEDAQEIIDQLLFSDNIFLKDYWMYVISKYAGDYSVALEHYENFAESGNEEVETTLREAVATYQRDFYESLAIIETRKVQMRNMLLLFLLIIIVAVLSIVSFRIFAYMKKVKREREETKNFVERLVGQIAAEQNEKADLKKRYIALHKAKYEILRDLCDQYYQFSGRVDLEEKIYKKVETLISSVRSNKATQLEFEKILNGEREEIMSRLREEMPKLKEVDYAMFAYYVVGFDALAIARFLDMSEANVYAHKRRLRLKIEKAHPLHEAQFKEVF